MLRDVVQTPPKGPPCLPGATRVEDVADGLSHCAADDTNNLAVLVSLWLLLARPLLADDVDGLPTSRSVMHILSALALVVVFDHDEVG